MSSLKRTPTVPGFPPQRISRAHRRNTRWVYWSVAVSVAALAYTVFILWGAVVRPH